MPRFGGAALARVGFGLLLLSRCALLRYVAWLLAVACASCFRASIADSGLVSPCVLAGGGGKRQLLSSAGAFSSLRAWGRVPPALDLVPACASSAWFPAQRIVLGCVRRSCVIRLILLPSLFTQVLQIVVQYAFTAIELTRAVAA